MSLIVVEKAASYCRSVRQITNTPP